MLSSAVLSIMLLAVTLLLLILFFLLPLLPLLGIQLGKLERRRIAIMGFPIAPSGHMRIHWQDRRQWLGARFSEQATWRELGSLIVGMLFGLLELTVMIIGVLVLVAVGLVTFLWIGYQVLQPEVLSSSVFFLGIEWVLSTPSDYARTCVVGLMLLLVCLVVLVYIGMILTVAQASITRALLLPRQEELQKHVARLRLSRMNLVDAFESERRRIERDLHDGVQQRLVSLSMTLGIAELEVEQAAQRNAPIGALRDAVSAAHDQAEAALADLRNTVRGIHPHVLADYGLAEAVGEISGRLPLKSEVTFNFDRRLPEQVELCAYFFVSEALTNAARHSGASVVRIVASLVDDELVVEVSDDGRGGAKLDSGSGLVGLQERAEALSGLVTVESPPGGPTVLRLAVPFSGA